MIKIRNYGQAIRLGHWSFVHFIVFRIQCSGFFKYPPHVLLRPPLGFLAQYDTYCTKSGPLLSSEILQGFQACKRSAMSYSQ